LIKHIPFRYGWKLESFKRYLPGDATLIIMQIVIEVIRFKSLVAQPES